MRSTTLNKVEKILLMASTFTSIRAIAIEVNCDHKTVCAVLQANNIEIPSLEQRKHLNFLRKISKDTNGCWNWTGYINENGYGGLSINNKGHLAHRYSYRYYKGDLNGLFVCHKCDNRKCCNPDHLFLGTLKDNMVDMMEKDRGSKKNIKLTRRDVKEVRELIATGECSIAQIALKFKVGETTIRRVRDRQCWNHVP
jgi:hypothetical protein